VLLKKDIPFGGKPCTLEFEWEDIQFGQFHGAGDMDGSGSGVMKKDEIYIEAILGIIIFLCLSGVGFLTNRCSQIILLCTG
jgi:hypothetical protein